jgi:hypothetical protein
VRIMLALSARFPTAGTQHYRILHGILTSVPSLTLVWPFTVVR